LRIADYRGVAWSTQTWPGDVGRKAPVGEAQRTECRADWLPEDVSGIFTPRSAPAPFFGQEAIYRIEKIVNLYHCLNLA
jgi:hypothetical protein